MYGLEMVEEKKKKKKKIICLFSLFIFLHPCLLRSLPFCTVKLLNYLKSV